jgi:hypothetical protein
MQKSINWGILVAILIFIGGQAMSDNSDAVNSIEISIPIGDYSIAFSDEGHEISIEDFGYLLIPGKPKLPSKIFTIALPPGAEVMTVDYEVGGITTLTGSYSVVPSPLPRSIGQEDPVVYGRDKKMYDDNYNLIYGSDEAYPGDAAELLGNAGYRNYNLVDIRVTPFSYRPQSGQLTYISQLNLIITCSIPESTSINVVAGDIPNAEKVAESFIFNMDQARNWYPSGGIKRGLNDFVIITLESLTNAVKRQKR